MNRIEFEAAVKAGKVRDVFVCLDYGNRPAFVECRLRRHKAAFLASPVSGHGSFRAYLRNIFPLGARPAGRQYKQLEQREKARRRLRSVRQYDFRQNLQVALDDSPKLVKAVRAVWPADRWNTRTDRPKWAALREEHLSRLCLMVANVRSGLPILYGFAEGGE